MAKDPVLMSELLRRSSECRLTKGDKIAFLPFDFLKQSIIPYGLGKTRLFIGHCYAFVEKGIICGINRSQSEDEEFEPFILPLSYIAASILTKNYDFFITRQLPVTLKHLEKLHKQPEETILINQKIANGVDISSAIPNNQIYIVDDVRSIKAEIIHQGLVSFWEPVEFTKIALVESNISMHFNGIDCLINNHLLNKQKFIDYIAERMHAEETVFRNSDTILPSHETITRLRTQTTEQERKRSQLSDSFERSELLHSYKVTLDHFKEQHIKNYKEKGENYCATFNINGHTVRYLELPSFWPNFLSKISPTDEILYPNREKYKNDRLFQKKIAELMTECRSDIERQERIIDYERQERQKKEQEEKAKIEGWKDIGNVILFIQVRTFAGEIKFKERSINVLQVNTIQNKFRIKIDNEYRDLKRVDISTSIFKTHYVYQVEPFCHLYILEDLSKRAI